MTIARYANYRDSGIDWAGEVPSHWSTLVLRRAVRLRTEKATGRRWPIGLENIESGTGRYVETDSEFEGEGVAFSASDVLYGKLRPYLAKVLVAPQQGEAIGDFHVLSPNQRRLNPNFLAYLLLCPPVVSLLNGSTYGARMPRVGWEFMSGLGMALPPLDEQAAIAAFLDRETGKIDALVEAQRRLIDLLGEKRQAAISHTVTKGLDPAARMKDSGAEWLGQVPAHWAVMPIRKAARLESGHTPSRQKAEYWVEEECVIPWFTLADVGVLRSGKVTHVSDTTHRISELGMANSAARLLPPETVFLSRTASVGFSGIMTRPMAVSQDFAAWVCGSDLSPDYLLLCLRAMRPEFRRLMMGSTHQTIYMPDIEKLSIPLPPRPEQEAIASFAFGQKALIDDLEEEVEAAIHLLRERRAGLISAAVTGKIDTRHLGATKVGATDQATARRLVGAAVLELVADTPASSRMTSAKRMYLAEAHAGVWELRGQPQRMAAGPFDGDEMSEVETELARVEHIATNQPGGRNSQVHYRLTGQQGALRSELDALLGDRRAVFDKMLVDLGELESRGVEAVATLYAVWNDMLIDGKTPTDDAVIDGVLNDWHAEKRDKFTRADLRNYLGWMGRHGMTPTGRGPRTKSGALL